MPNTYRIVFHLEDSHGFKWAESAPITADSIEWADTAGRLYQDYRNGNPLNVVKVTGYKAYQTN
jgi:hypothetical protein